MAVEISPSATVTLDGSGNGQVSIGPPSGTSWQLRLASVSTNSTVKSSQCILYRGSTSGPIEVIDQTFLGNSASTGKVAGAAFYSGQVLWAKWTGGDPGAQAVLQVYGQQGARSQLPFDAAVGEGFPLTLATVFQAGNTLINSSGAFVYSGTPAHGNLIYSVAAAAGTDPFGNPYQAGATDYFGNLTAQVVSGLISFFNGTTGTGAQLGLLGNANAPADSLQLVASPGVWVNGMLILHPSGVISGTRDALAINTAIASMPSTGGTIILAPGQWYLRPGDVVISVAKPVWFMAHGAFINTVAGLSGDLIRWYDTTNPVGRNYFGGGWIGGIIDGTSASAGVTAMHFGDIEAPVMRDLTIQNFPTGQSLRLDNSLWWTEEADMRVVVVNCPGPTFEVTGGFRSFGYGNFDFTVISNVGLNGVQVLNGAFLYHGSLRIRGNFFGNSSAVSNFAFGMSGVAPAGSSAGATSLMQAMRFEMQVECATAAFTPKAIVMDSVNFAFANELEGIIDLSNGSGTFAPSTIATGQFSFTGMVNANGDTALSPVAGYWSNINAPVVYRSVVNFFQATFPTPLGDMFRTTLAGNWTVALTAAGINGNQTLPYPQRVTIVIQQSAGGANTVTWPHPVTPTLSAPTVLWPGGVAPTMTAAANAVDIYDLETLDGIRWYGRALQNVS